MSRAAVAQSWQRALDLAPVPGQGGSLTRFFQQCALNLPDILAGDLAVQTLLFADDDVATEIYQANAASRYTNTVAATAIAMRCRALVAEGRVPAILEVGGGVGGTTDVVLDELTGLPLRYHFTDVGDWFCTNAQQRFAGRSGLTVGRLDINAHPEQSRQLLPKIEEGFDVVLAANVMHNAIDVTAVLDFLADCCRPGAILVLIETGTEHLPLLISMRFLMAAPAGGRGFGVDSENRDRILLPTAEWNRAIDSSAWQLEAVFPGEQPQHLVARYDQHVWVATYRHAVAKPPVD